MSFLTPLFFVGLGAIAIPILVHLIQREKKHVVFFPSLMLVQKIPYQSVRRRRIRHWFLLLMRVAALVLIAMAFSRPFLPQKAQAAVAAIGGNREIVIMLDRSASMGFGDHWKRARDAARSAMGSIGMNDKATLVLFDKNTEEAVRATGDRGRLESGLNAATVGAAGTHYGPALKLAESILSRSTLQRREAILISDFQKTGWNGAEDVHFGDNIRVTPVVIRSDNMTNLAVPSANFSRVPFAGQEKVSLTAGVSNKSTDAASKVPVTLELDGHTIETQAVNVAPNASTSVPFAQFTIGDAMARGVVKAGTDALPADNSFYFVLSPIQAVSVLIVDNGDAKESFYLKNALAIGKSPTYQIEVMPAARVTPAIIERRSVVILNDTTLPPSLAGGDLKRFVERGGGLLIVLGERAAWPSTETDLLPGKIGGIVDRRSKSRGATIGQKEWSHEIFEIFKAPRSGDFSAAHIRQYRSLQLGPADRWLAKYDDGGIAAAERRVGAGRVIALTTSLDESWTDLPKQPVYLPLVDRVVRYLARYEQPAAWHTVGDIVDLSVNNRGERVVMTPANERKTIHANEPPQMELNQQGIYEVRATSTGTGRPERIAVNIDPIESDLSPLDPQELVAAVTGKATQASGQSSQASTLAPDEAEKRQNIWWYLLLAGLMLLATETVVANTLSRKERFL